MAEKRDYYEVLGLSKSANEKEIKKAYRALAKKYHPDVNKEPGSEERFKEINEAYEVLSDPQKKANYDQFGFAGVDGSGFGGFSGGGFSGGFDGFTQGSSRRNRTGPMKGQDRYMSLNISFMDAVFGKTETLHLSVDEQCSHCHGTGAESKSDIETCSTCNGRGTVISQQRTPFGVFQSQSVCPDCHGTGKRIKVKCHQCHGSGYETKKVGVDVKIPAGIQTGQQLRVANKGERGANGGPNGDLYIEIRVGKHNLFERRGNDIHVKVPLSAVDATLGTVIDVPTPYGDVELKIPAGTQPNTTFRLKDKGVVSINSNKKGDELVQVEVVINTKLSREEKELYQKLQGSNPKGKSNNPFDRIKKAFE